MTGPNTSPTSGGANRVPFGARAGVDIGGTFTDVAVITASGTSSVAKVLTTPQDPSLGALEGIRQALEPLKVTFEDLREVIHATTLATNTLLEAKGARVGLITTRGFRDILEMRTESRYDLYDLKPIFPPPLVPRHLRREVTERIGADGVVVEPLDEGEVASVIRAFLLEEIHDLAVVFLHSYANPQHELAVQRIAMSLDETLNVSVSCTLQPELREYQRASTTVVNAYVKPRIQRYLADFGTSLGQLGFQGSLRIMSSAGGVLPVDLAASSPALLIESGPAAGALAASMYCEQQQVRDAIAFDMGGTTAKICILKDGTPSSSHEFEAARVARFKRGSGYPIQLPVIELIEIGAGGGSIARVDQLGLVKVGPEGASSYPGPACYGLGGGQPTVTDADLVLGYLNPDYFLGGKMPLDVSAAHQAVHDSIASPLGLDVLMAAWGIHDLVNENMAAACRIHTIERGFDPRSFALVAFGGAGPVHAQAVARKLGIRTVMIPPAAGIASAVGLLGAAPKVNLVRTQLSRLDDLVDATLLRAFEDLERDVPISSSAGLTTTRHLDMRFVGQGYQVTIDLPGKTRAGLVSVARDRFLAEYERLFGRVPGNMPLEVVSYRSTVAGAPPTLDVMSIGRARTDRGSSKTHRDVYFADAGAFVRCPVYDRYSLESGFVFPGPAIVEEIESTTVVGPGQTCVVSDSMLVLTIN